MATKASEATVEQAMYGTGISIEEPDLFEYNGRWYLFAAEISNPDVSIQPERLDNKNVQLFEYTNEVNSLCLRGKITYSDWDGRISKYFNRMDNHMTVGCKQMKKVQDGKMEHFEEMNRGEESMFAHVFIVQNIGIVSRENQIITYEIELISKSWYQICATLVYSNYGSNDTKDKNVYNIMEKLFRLDDLIIEEAGWKNISSRSNILLDYATSGNDTLFTAIPYLFNRLYLAKNQYESTLKFIAYDPINDLYRLMDYSDETTWCKISKPIVVLSLFETQYEQMMFAKNSQMASTVSKKQTETYEDMFKHTVWEYKKSVNRLINDHSSFSSEDLRTFMNSKSKALDSSKYKMLNKYNELNPLWFKIKEFGRYQQQTALWNNDFSIYQNVLDNMIKRDSVIVNSDGDITHQPGCIAAILLDRTIEKVPELTSKQKKELYEKHRQIEGMFQIFKVRHMYKPSTPHPSYTENLVFARNYILTPSSNDSIANANDGIVFNDKFESFFSKTV